MKKFLFFLVFSFVFLFSANTASVLSKPYKVYVLKTDHFDILFPKQSQETAYIIGQNIEELYEKAQKSLKSTAKLHIPVVISPDSDDFSVTYTPNPYNRIIVFEAYPGLSVQSENEFLLEKLYEEIFRAVLQSERSKFNTFISNTIGGSSYQPVALLNMPFSFIQGFISISEKFSTLSQYENYEIQDQKQLELLVQAKIEGKFPNHFQVRIANDIYPYNQVILAAAAGFSAYLLQAYGIEKYLELWKESGKLNLMFADGVFYNVYKKNISVLWKEFYDCVPVPQNIDEILENAAEMMK